MISGLVTQSQHLRSAFKAIYNINIYTHCVSQYNLKILQYYFKAISPSPNRIVSFSVFSADVFKTLKPPVPWVGEVLSMMVSDISSQIYCNTNRHTHCQGVSHFCLVVSYLSVRVKKENLIGGWQVLLVSWSPFLWSHIMRLCGCVVEGISRFLSGGTTL